MKLFRWLLLILLCAVAALGYLGISLYTAYAGFQQPVFVDLPKGTSAARMADLLQNAGVIRHSWAFLIARAFRRGATLQAGEYRFAKPASVLEVFDRIQRGDIFYYELVVPEGKNMFDIAAAAERLGVFPAEQLSGGGAQPGDHSRSRSVGADFGRLPVPEYVSAAAQHHARAIVPDYDR